MTTEPPAPEADRIRSEGKSRQLVLVVEIADRRIGLPADAVIEVQPAAALIPLPGAPPVIQGAVDLRGEVIAVLDGRLRVGVPSRARRLGDRFVVTRSRARIVALRVDAVLDLVEVTAADLDNAVALAPDALRDVGMARLDDGLIVVHDPDTFLSAEEASDLDAALAGRR